MSAAAPFVVHKFGGTSVGSVQSIREVARILERGDLACSTGSLQAAAAGAGAGEADVKRAADAAGRTEGLPRGSAAAVAPRLAVVVSAMGGKPKVTDMLLSTVADAVAGNVRAFFFSSSFYFLQSVFMVCVGGFACAWDTRACE